MVIEIEGNSKEAGTPLVLWDQNKENFRNQLFKFKKVKGDDQKFEVRDKDDKDDKDDRKRRFLEKSSHSSK